MFPRYKLTSRCSGILHIVLIVLSDRGLSGGVSLQYFGPDRTESKETSQGDTRYVKPIPCHSHNDYWREHPLFDALHAGCTSVEADLWLDDMGAELYVGHSKASLTADRTLDSMYLEALLRLLGTA